MGKRGRPKKPRQRYHLTKADLEQRRNRVFELRLAGFGPAAIADELRKIPEFANTGPDTVWNDIRWWEKRGELVQIDPETITRGTYLDAQAALLVQGQHASRRFLVYNDEFDVLAVELKTLTEEYPDAAKKRKTAITKRRTAVNGELAGLQNRVIREARLILSIVESLTDIPKKLGLIPDRTEVGVHDITKEKMIEAIENAPTSEKRKELIRAAELYGGVTSFI